MHSKNKSRLIGLVLLCVLYSCRKEELPVAPYDRGDQLSGSVNMGSDYRQQLFFSLSANSVVASNIKTTWDLAFESAPEGYRVRLNSAKAMCAANTGQTSFSAVSDTAGFSQQKRYDMPGGHDDSTAIGDWRNGQPVYIIFLGYNPAGAALGYKKMQVLSVNSNAFVVKTADLNGNNENTSSILKNNGCTRTYFSIASNTVVSVEPGSQNYDLLFTQYTHVYENPASVYLVTGVLLNPKCVRVARVFDKSFSSVGLADTLAHPFSTALNAIGYDWKTYNYQTATYEIDANKSYIIQDVQGFYYKLHFIDFYTSTGLKGQPKFEFRKL
jgi:hypothetical protein